MAAPRELRHTISRVFFWRIYTGCRNESLCMTLNHPSPFWASVSPSNTTLMGLSSHRQPTSNPDTPPPPFVGLGFPIWQASMAWNHTAQKPRRWRSPLWVQSMAGLSWPCQELLQTCRSSTRTSTSISPGGGSSKSDTKPQPDTRQRIPTMGGLAPLRGNRNSLTAGPRIAEPFSCRKYARFSATHSHT